MEHSHLAVGSDDALDVRVEIHWTPGLTEFMVVVRNASDLIEHGTYRGLVQDPMPAGTLRSSALDSIAAQTLGHYMVITSRWVVDPVSLAGYFAKTTGFEWVPEKLANVE
ncbi:hypothetical protein [Streptomyces sp. NPDC051662]|uniref:hypothetical protein n=1 Tax=Streptomyces sp. NPDC051662 TaxID=3154750 RepID=UPI0034356585